jgi:hypothetical protein
MAGKKRSSERPKRDPLDLEAAARHVSYELGMLFHSAARLGGWHGSPITAPEGSDKNMALECFLLHFRNLRAFLCPFLQAFSDDDVIASDLLGEPKARDVADGIVLSKDKKRLDKMLAHLSYSRKTYVEAQDYGWPTAEMELALLDQLEVFFGKLSPERREWFPPAEKLATERTNTEHDKRAVSSYQTTTCVVTNSRATVVVHREAKTSQ